MTSWRWLRGWCPRAYDFLLEARHTLNGGRSAEQSQAVQAKLHALSVRLDALEGQRTQEASAELELLRERLDALASQHARLQSRLLTAAVFAQRLLDAVPARFALFSPMPPAQTGVGIANLKTCVEAGISVDIFSEWADPAALAYFESLRGAAQRGWDASLFGTLAARRPYERVVVSIGNSAHNDSIIAHWLRPEVRAMARNLTLHLHDPTMRHAVCRLFPPNGVELAQRLHDAYGETRARAFEPALASRHPDLIIGTMERQELCGAGVVLDAIRPHRVIVNSDRARELIEREFDGAVPFELVRGLHPVFAADARSARPRPGPRQRARLGCFGVPPPDKALPVLAEACRELRDAGQGVTLVMAGYGMRAYRAGHASLYEGLDVEWHVDITEAELAALMDGIHAAVQLRPHNHGESSGVVAALMARQCPLIVSKAGSFLQYEGAAWMAPPGIAAPDLAQMIRAMLADPERHAEGAAAYARCHRADELARAWFGDGFERP